MSKSKLTRQQLAQENERLRQQIVELQEANRRLAAHARECQDEDRYNYAYGC